MGKRSQFGDAERARIADMLGSGIPSPAIASCPRGELTKAHDRTASEMNPVIESSYSEMKES